MTPAYSDPLVTLYEGDCLDVMRELPDVSVDAVVTDPPYGIQFMGRHWDHGVPGVDFWREMLRVLKPGGYLLSFAGTRTVHRFGVAIEDAGFEIRDTLMWIYASGFPKSLDVSKALDKRRDDGPAIRRVTAFVAANRGGMTNDKIDAAFGFNGMAGHWTTQAPQAAVPKWDQWLRLKELLGFGDEMDVEVWRLNGRKGKPGEAWDQREKVGERETGAALSGNRDEGWGSGRNVVDITAPATDLARKWEGWGTALKPAHEPIVMARKPLVGTVAQNVTRYGTGALNIDGSRIKHGEDTRRKPVPTKGWVISSPTSGSMDDSALAGRWPSNVLLSSPELFDEPNPGVVGSGAEARAATSRTRMGGTDSFLQRVGELEPDDVYDDGGGGYSRFFLIPSRYNGTCVRCGLALNAEQTSYRLSPSAASAPSDAPTSPDGTPDSTARATKARSRGTYTNMPSGATIWQPSPESDTTESPTSRRRGTSPASAPPSSRAKSPDAASPETGTTTTTVVRSMCATCVEAITWPTTSDELRDYPVALIIPKADRAERERGLAGAPKSLAKIGNHGNLSAGDDLSKKLGTNEPRANTHPTVKPIDLMRHLVRLVTPPGGTVLDPFLGSGTTALAASEEGVKCIGIEREPEYVQIAVSRLIATPMGLGLFEEPVA